MCGITGFIDNTRSKDYLIRMTNSLAHRGPDDKGYFLENGVGLGHQRLSILDLSPNGHQPMEFENLVLVYNGEIYNFKEIREALVQKGYTFISNSDTEVLLKAFHCWREDAVQKFIGMFAFALYDKNSNELFLFRDRVGVKPLYYFYDKKNIAFASELRALKIYLKKPSINKIALSEYFKFAYISSDLSIFEQCHKLEPGSYLVFNKGKIIKKKYWQVESFFHETFGDKTEEKLCDEMESLLISCFGYRMISDVPVGVFLSGGIDSSLLAAILQKHYGSINTFTIGFKETPYDESRFAKQIADHLGTNHEEKILDINLARDFMYSFADIYDEPYGDSSGIPTTLVSRIAKEAGVKVVLSADGGDELFCGYWRYWRVNNIGAKIFMIPYPIRMMLAKMLVYIGEHSTPKCASIKNYGHKRNQLIEMLKDKEWIELYEKNIHIIKNYEMRKLLVEPMRNFKIMENGMEDLEAMQEMMLWDFKYYLPDDILVKVDRATMFNSIEGREPFLDHRIIEFAAKLPFNMKYHNGKSKYILRKILERYIPANLFERPKQGFAIPIFEWFSNDLQNLFDKYLTRERIEDQGILNYAYIGKQLQHLKNKRVVNINMLWLILVFQMWYEKWMD